MKLQEYKVWDTTTRVFHWLNALCVLGLLAIGTIILNADALGVHNDGKVILKTTHVWIGYVFVLNLLWRLVWATPNGQAAFLFLLTSALAPLIRLGYMQMLWMAPPYTITMSVLGGRCHPSHGKT